MDLKNCKDLRALERHLDAKERQKPVDDVLGFIIFGVISATTIVLWLAI